MRHGERIRLRHLSGEQAGQAAEWARLPLTVGSGPDADVTVSDAAPRHFVVFAREHEVRVLDSGSGRTTRVNGQPVQEAVLHHGDEIQLGADGPRFRFERDERAPGRRRSDGAPVPFLRRGLGRWLAAALLLAAATGVAALGWNWRESRRLRGEVTTLRDAFQHADDGRRRLEARVDEERRRAAEERARLQARLNEFRSREEDLRRQLAAAAADQTQRLAGELTATRHRIHALENERAAGEDVIRRYGAGVCLIQGSYGYDDADGRPLRTARQADDAAPHADGTALLTPDGDGPPHTVNYYGTGFLVDDQGLILTNRHLAEPWWNDDEAESMQKAGYRPRLISLRVFFPRQPQPFEARLERRSDSVDLALLRVDLRGSPIPVLPLDRSHLGAVAGQPVVVVGYPAGLEAILAKAESSVVQSILESHGADSQRVTEALSMQGLIRPSTTQGHIGDITGSDIVYDAPTTQGGSGGPVFNKHGHVIAVEYAVLPRFGGNSFGVPITYALELLGVATRPHG